MSVGDLLADPTLQRVALGAAALGVVSGVLGSFTLLRRQSLLGDALSHAALPGLCIGFMIAGARAPSALLAGAFVSGGLAALVVMLVGRMSRIKPDAALGIVLSVFFAAGMALLSYLQAQGAEGASTLSAFLFGQAAAMLRADLVAMLVAGGFALALVALFWKELKLMAFDAPFARSQGLPVGALEALLAVVVALAIVIGLQMVGVVLMAAMLIAPAAAARQWAGRLETMVLLAAGFGAVAGLVGALLSATARGLATGPLVVLVAVVFALGSILLAPGRGVIWRSIATRRSRAGLEEARVLAALQDLAQAHDNPGYAAPRAMLGGLLPVAPTRGLMARMAARGLVRAVIHPPDERPRWELTEAGRTIAAEAADG